MNNVHLPSIDRRNEAYSKVLTIMDVHNVRARAETVTTSEDCLTFNFVFLATFQLNCGSMGELFKRVHAIRALKLSKCKTAPSPKCPWLNNKPRHNFYSRRTRDVKT